jgi:ribosomal protein L21E
MSSSKEQWMHTSEEFKTGERVGIVTGIGHLTGCVDVEAYRGRTGRVTSVRKRGDDVLVSVKLDGGPVIVADAVNVERIC